MTASRIAAPFEKCSRIRGRTSGMGLGGAGAGSGARGRPETRQGERTRRGRGDSTRRPTRSSPAGTGSTWRQSLQSRRPAGIGPSGRDATLSRWLRWGMCPRRPCVLAALTVLLAVRGAAPASAQTVEVAPFAGYRFGGDLFELATNHQQDLDGAPAFGGAVSVEMANGFWFEALFSHQQADVDIAGGPFSPRVRTRAVVNHWLAGGRQDLRVRAVRSPSSPGSWDSPTTGPTAKTRSASRSAAVEASNSRSRGAWACGSMAGCSRRSSTSTPAPRAPAAASSASTSTSCGRPSSPPAWSSSSERRAQLNPLQDVRASPREGSARCLLRSARAPSRRRTSSPAPPAAGGLEGAADDTSCRPEPARLAAHAPVLAGSALAGNATIQLSAANPR